MTDVMRFVEDTATVLTRGAEATVHETWLGDVLVIPAGVPHEPTAVSDPFDDGVVKVEG